MLLPIKNSASVDLIKSNGYSQSRIGASFFCLIPREGVSFVPNLGDLACRMIGSFVQNGVGGFHGCTDRFG